MSHADGRPVMPPCRMSIRRLYGSFRRVVWGDGGVCSLMTKSPAFDARTEMVAPKAFGRFTPRFTPPAQNDVKTGTGAFARTTCQKRKRLDNRQIVKPFLSVGVTGFEPATTRPPDVYSNRTELRPDSCSLTRGPLPEKHLPRVWDCKYSVFFSKQHFFAIFFFYFCAI